MALARILVDGFSLLHAWPELARGKARHSPAARDELVQRVRRYADAIGTPITIVFDGRGAAPSAGLEMASTPALEILYSKSGQTADDIIERAAARLVSYGEVLVVSDDLAERETVASAGASCCSCAHFILQMEGSVGEFEKTLARHNQAERSRYFKK